MISNKNVFYHFSKNNPSIKTVGLNESVTLETIDAFGGQIKSDTDLFDSIDWEKINPATGPIYINSAMPGDLLKVTIQGIDINSTGVMISTPDAGLFGDLHKQTTIKLFNIEDNYTTLNDLVLPLSPMIGVIGVAPENEDISNGVPGPHGGNMDNKKITVGSVLYLPVFHEGALFGLGDLHAAMGDGEVNVSGLEVSGKVTVSFDLIKNASNGHPLLIKDGQFYTIFSDTTIDEAITGSAHQMLYWVKKALDYNDSDAAMLLSLVGNTEICQVVDPQKTARFSMPNLYFRNLNL